MSSSFGKQPLGANGKRGTDCLVLEYSEMIVVRALHVLGKNKSKNNEE